MGNENDRRSRRSDANGVNRRWFVGALGTGAMAGLAGCGSGDGDGDGGDGGGDDTTTTTTTTESGDGGGGEDETTTEEEDGDETTTEGETQRYDVLVGVDRRPPAPADTQYQQYSSINRATFDGMMDYALLSRSYADQNVYGEIVDEWNYRPGLLEMTFHDDFYYWDGTNIDADNVLLHWRLQNFVDGGEELNAHPNVIRAEKTGDYSIRLALADTWREDYAIVQTVEGWSPQGSGEYYRPWLQRFRDASSQEAIQNLRTEIDETTEKDPTMFFHNAFKITGAEEDRWKMQLRTEENNALDGGVPHFVDDINFLRFDVISNQEEQRSKQLFIDQIRPYGGAGDFNPEDLDFEVTRAQFARPADQWSFLFNCSQPPTNNVHFRKAIAYMTNRKQYQRPSGIVPNERVTPFMTPSREEQFVSQDVLDSLTDYGWDEVRPEEATREMQEGGFERNSNGQWTYREGDRAGEPMSFTYGAYVWMDHVGNQGTDFRETLSDWGIDVTFEKSESHWGDVGEGNFEWAAAYWGGGLPPQTMGVNFGELSGGEGNPQLPATVEAPPVGDPDGSMRTYETATMTNRLKVTQDDQQYQELVDRLTWVYNQIVPRFGIEGTVQSSYVNDTKFDLISQEEAPELWTRLFFRRIWNNGMLSYVPPERR